MKEVFANFMAAKIVNPSFPGVNHDLRFLHALLPARLRRRPHAGTNAIRQPLDNLNDAGTLYGAIIYQKAPIVMRQLETIMGRRRVSGRPARVPARTRSATRPGRISLRVLDQRTPEDLAAWSHAWVEEARTPSRHDRTVGGQRTDRTPRLYDSAIRIRGAASPGPRTFRSRSATPIASSSFPCTSAATRTEVAAARGLPAPLFVLPNGGGIAYGDIHLDRQSLAWLSQHLPDIGDALTRGSRMGHAVGRHARRASCRPNAFCDLAIAALPREDNELNVQRILVLPRTGRLEIRPRLGATRRAPRSSRRCAMVSREPRRPA